MVYCVVLAASLVFAATQVSKYLAIHRNDPTNREEFDGQSLLRSTSQPAMPTTATKDTPTSLLRFATDGVGEVLSVVAAEKLAPLPASGVFVSGFRRKTADSTDVIVTCRLVGKPEDAVVHYKSVFGAKGLKLLSDSGSRGRGSAKEASRRTLIFVVKGRSVTVSLRNERKDSNIVRIVVKITDIRPASRR